ncbi:MAG: hypothetical protein NW203_14840 [Hyphomonadaceae bacterium]|nr:hypothetical protein [Hyphomonadaceae bacterium]
MNDALVLAGSALVVVVLVAIAALLGFRDRARLTSRADVAEALAATDRAASILDAAIDREGRAAIAMLSDGRLALAKAMADHVAVRVIAPGAVRVRIRARGEAALVRAGVADVGFPGITLHLVRAPDWLSAMVQEPRKDVRHASAV